MDRSSVHSLMECAKRIRTHIQEKVDMYYLNADELGFEEDQDEDEFHKENHIKTDQNYTYSLLEQDVKVWKYPWILLWHKKIFFTH